MTIFLYTLITILYLFIGAVICGIYNKTKFYQRKEDEIFIAFLFFGWPIVAFLTLLFYVPGILCVKIYNIGTGLVNIVYNL